MTVKRLNRCENIVELAKELGAIGGCCMAGERS
jgi:hypothetical protein